MGKRLRHQRRGKGSNIYRAKSHRFKSTVSYRNIDDLEKEEITGKIEEIVNDPSRTTLLVKVRYENGEIKYLPAPEGIMVGEEIKEGYETKPKQGNIIPLGEIPEGYPVFNIENNPGDGGKIARSSGAVSWITAKDEKSVKVKLPSKEIKSFNPNCRATVGKAAGGGRTEKPMLKAGNNYHKHRAKGTKYPTVRGVAMNAVDHPFGGKEHHHSVTKRGKGGTAGQHIGSFGSKSTGRKEGKE